MNLAVIHARRYTNLAVIIEQRYMYITVIIERYRIAAKI